MDTIDLSDVVVAKPTNARVDYRSIEFDTNSFHVGVLYDLAGQSRSIDIEISAAEVIGAASNPAMQACLVELRTILNAITKSKAKAALEA